MSRVLDVIRGLFLAGTVSMIIYLLYPGSDVMFLVMLAKMNWVFYLTFFSVFFLISPILYIILVLASVAYFRWNEQVAITYQAQSVFSDIIECINKDIVSPFKCVRGFEDALAGENVSERGILVRRFIGLLLLISFCSFGLGAIL